ncbi:MAG TPA: GDP-mannose 4,6-dehydratase [Petrotogaceae bacterium]|nr:GDP-mannose 4,6-dehydratase [Petrotogaceae bacterium]
MIYSINLEEWIDKNFLNQIENYKNLQNLFNKSIVQSIIENEDNDSATLLIGYYNPFSYSYIGQIMDSIELLVSFKKISKIIYFSSFGVYKPKFEGKYREDDTVQPYNSIGLNALLYEDFFTFLNTRYSTDIYILRNFSIYGPMQNDISLIPNLMKGFIKNEEVYIGDMKKVRDYLYIEDFIFLVKKMIEEKKSHEKKVYNIGSGKGTDIKTLINIMNCISNIKVNAIFDPSKIRKEYDYDYVVADIEKISTDYGFSQKISLEEGLKLTYQWASGRVCI